ncbi:S-crystallin 3-like [Octopus vulgaris]|uniref:S-crystallin 3-like n=1 Tax=Octopus vulgaris TaxID=6645 RepID=A0AA36AVP9_OCTVU|nr:S-crystallin 3-like [Octopus vulgaris]
MLFAVADVRYNDNRIEFKEWINFRKNMTCSMMPVLETQKCQIPQSMTISRYIAREYGLHGKSNLEMARVESITDCLYEILDVYMRMYHEMDGRLVSDMRRIFEQTCRNILPYLEDTLKTCNGGDEFFCGDKMLLCDIMCFAALENPTTEDPCLLKDYPKLQALREKVANHPKIASYLSKRNATSF